MRKRTEAVVNLRIISNMILKKTGTKSKKMASNRIEPRLPRVLLARCMLRR